MTTTKKKDNVLHYKGHPMLRQGNIIYYGDASEKYMVMMQILSTEKIKDVDIATRVSVQLQLTNTKIRTKDRIVKSIEKDGLYSAMDIAIVWLERALSGNKSSAKFGGTSCEKQRNLN